LARPANSGKKVKIAYNEETDFTITMGVSLHVGSASVTKGVTAMLNIS